MLKSRPAITALIVLTVVLAISVARCGGGGGGDGGGTAPTLINITFSPASAAAGLTVDISGTISFQDPDGNLDGGSFNYTYDGTTYSLPLPPEIGGITDGTGSFSIVAVLNSDTGTINVPAWLVDNTGLISNTVNMSFTQLWTRQFGTLLEDIGRALTIDNAVFVGGTTNGDLQGEINQGVSDVFITRYAADTTRLWTRLIGSDNTDNGRGVAVDSNNNIYVTGDTNGTLFDGEVADGLLDGFVTRLDATGNRVWTRIIGANGASDRANAIATDTGNNIYVTGSTTGNLNGELNQGSWDAFLVKYDTNGNPVWTRLLGTSAPDHAYAVATDQIGNVYVAGATDGVLGVDPSPGDPVVNADVFVAKYDSSGNLGWVAQLGTSCAEWANAVAVDANGNAYAGGKILQCALEGNTANGGYDAFIARIDSAGNSQWVRQFGTSDHDSVNGIAVDSTNNPYVTGYLDSVYASNDDNEGHSILLAKFNDAGDMTWQVLENADYSWGNQGFSIDLDSGGNIFMTGAIHGQIDGYTNQSLGEDDVFILKHDSTGTRR